jgi:hypothetical protein
VVTLPSCGRNHAPPRDRFQFKQPRGITGSGRQTSSYSDRMRYSGKYRLCRQYRFL